MVTRIVNMKDYKEGDITPNGWEVVSVNYRPQYLRTN